jgi:hypothetical protein
VRGPRDPRPARRVARPRNWRRAASKASRCTT